MNGRCDKCIYWQKPSSSPMSAADVGRAYANLGKCRVNPPTIASSDMSDAPLGRWPLTEATDWCGEFDSGRPLV